MRFTNEDHVVIDYKGKKFKFPMILVSLLSIAKRRVDLKLDNIWLISGMVGVGKSTLAKGIAGVYQILFGRELSLDNFTWSSKGFIDFTDYPENETNVIVQDEGIVGMTGRDTITKTGQQLKITLVTKRRMRIFYIILIDEIQEYSQKVINRSTLLLDARFIMKNGDPTRGFFKIYNSDEIKEVYWLLKEKKINSIQQYNAGIKPFYKFWDYENVFFDEKEYEAKKIEETKQNSDDTNISWKIEKTKAFGMWCRGIKQVDIAQELGLDQSTISKYVRDFKHVMNEK